MTGEAPLAGAQIGINPCPFPCGWEGPEYKNVAGGGFRYNVSCVCGAYGPAAATPVDAIALWNRAAR